MMTSGPVDASAPALVAVIMVVAAVVVRMVGGRCDDGISTEVDTAPIHDYGS